MQNIYIHTDLTCFQSIKLNIDLKKKNEIKVLEKSSQIELDFDNENYICNFNRYVVWTLFYCSMFSLILHIIL